MPSQVPPVAAAVEVPGSPVVGNPYTILDGTKIVVDRIDEEDSLHHIFYWIGFKIEDHIVLLTEYGLDSKKLVDTLVQCSLRQILGNGELQCLIAT